MFICRKNMFFYKYCILIILCVAMNTTITKTRILFDHDTLLCVGIVCTQTLFEIINIFLICEVRKGNLHNIPYMSFSKLVAMEMHRLPRWQQAKNDS